LDPNIKPKENLN